MNTLEKLRPRCLKVKKPLTEEQTRVLDRMLSGQSMQEAADAEGIDREDLWYWKQLGTAFEEIQREKLSARWESCQMMTMNLLWQGLNRLVKIIEEGSDADAIKASGTALKMKAAIAPEGFKFKLTRDEESQQIRFRNVSKDYYVETPVEEEIVIKPAGAYAGKPYLKKMAE